MLFFLPSSSKKLAFFLYKTRTMTSNSSEQYAKHYRVLDRKEESGEKRVSIEKPKHLYKNIHICQ